MRLKEIRVAQAMSIPELFRRSGVPVRTIEEIEKRDNCTVAIALKLAKALVVDMNTLCAEKGEA